MANLPMIRRTLTGIKMQEVIKQRIGKKAGAFTTTLLDVIGATPALQACDPALVAMEALKAAALDLPINKNLGFAYVIPYKEKGVSKPRFQMGYKGYLQLAIRTGQYKHLNAGMVYEGEEMIEDRIKGTLVIEGKRTSDKVIGYFSYMCLINGFEKAICWSVEQVKAHAKKFSKSFSSYSSPWKSDFDAMAQKTMLLRLVKYMPMSIEMSQALINDSADNKRMQEPPEETEIIDIGLSQDADEPVGNIDDNGGEMSDEEKKEIMEQEAVEAEQEAPY